MKTFVITGGPCSGKTSAMNVLRTRLAAQGIPAIFVEEAGTDLIMEGVSPSALGSMLPFQTRVAALQVEREAQAKERARTLEAENLETRAKQNIQAAEPSCTTHQKVGEVLVICDRGICDGAAYVNPEEYAHVLSANELDAATVMQRYDAVFCLESTAKLDDGSYTTENNSARGETPEEAAALDDRTRAAWEAHPHFYFIANEGTFEAKAEKLIRAILSELPRPSSVSRALPS